jgi:type I restriction enzyme S subunit
MMKTWPLTKLTDILTPISRPEKVDPVKKYRLLGIRLNGAGSFLREIKTGAEIAANNLLRVHAGDFIYKINEIAPINMGQSPPGDSYNNIGDGVPLLNGPTEFGNHHPTPMQWTTAPTKLSKKGDILLCVRGATTGKMNWADREYCIGRGLAALTPKLEVSVPEYIYFFIQTQAQEMLSRSAGSTFPNLPGEKLKTVEIPIPPPAEQIRIVEYLDNLQSKIDKLKKLQTETQKELDALMPSILDKAFKGEL